MKLEFRIPIPPLALGVSWTASTLLNYCHEVADSGGKVALASMLEALGPIEFLAIFSEKAKELNERFDARGHAAPPRIGAN